MSFKMNRKIDFEVPTMVIKKNPELSKKTKSIIKKLKFSFVVLFFLVHFCSYAPLSLFADSGENCLCGAGIAAVADCSKCSESSECSECPECVCFAVLEAKEVSARAVLDSDKPMKSCDDYLDDYLKEHRNCKEERKIEYVVFMITCFIMNGVALGMVFLSNRKKNIKEAAQTFDDEH